MSTRHDPSYQAALGACSHAILLLPSSDEATSIQILTHRTRALGVFGVFGQEWDWVETFVRHSANRPLATHFAYSKERLPTESGDQIVALVRGTAL